MTHARRRRPANLITMQRAHGVACHIAQIDREVAALHAEGYMVDVDRLLDERQALTDARRELGLEETM